jgi:sulfonate transport system substrate-binding protein
MLSVRVPVLAAAALALVPLTACSSGKATTSAAASHPSSSVARADLSGVTLRVGDQARLTQAELQAAGADNTPYKIEWSAFTSGPPLLQALSSNAIDLGGVGDAPPIFAAAGGADIKAVYASATPEINQGVIVKPGSNVTSVAELKGKKIGVAQGSSANWILLKALQDNHLSPTDVQIAYLQPPAAQAAMSSGSIDAWVIWDPFSTVVESQGAKLILSGQDLHIPGLGFEVTNSKAMQDPGKSAAIDDFLGRLRRAQAWANDHVDTWAQTYSQLTKLAPDVATKVLHLTAPAPAKLDGALIAAEQAEADAFYGAKLIPTKVDVSRFIDARFPDIANPK